jgi:hypothetical protein
MQKSLRSFAEKMFLPVSFSVVLLLTGCGGTIGDEDTDEARQYEAQMALDSGNYDRAIALLLDGCAGYGYEACQLQLGSAYLGKAGMDIISLGKDLVRIDGNDSWTDAQKDTQTMTVLFDIIFDDSVAQAAAIYKNLLPLDGAECNSVSYPLLTGVQKQACLAINPILLQELLADDDTAQTETLPVDIATLAEFRDVLDAVIPGITTEEIVSILDDSDPDQSKDVNNNTDIDSMEATECAITSYNDNNNSGFSAYACLTPDISVLAYDLNEADFTDINETIYAVRVEVNSSTAYADVNFTRLVTPVTAGVYTSVTTDGFCTTAGVTCTQGDAGCYPCPVVTDGQLETLNTTVVDVLNDDTLLTSIAVLSDSNDSLTSEEKVDNFTNDVCNVTGTAGPSNYGDCTWDATEGELVISQDALLDYMAQ